MYSIQWKCTLYNIYFIVEVYVLQCTVYRGNVQYTINVQHTVEVYSEQYTVEVYSIQKKSWYCGSGSEGVVVWWCDIGSVIVW